MNGKELLFAALENQHTERPAWVPFVGVHGAQITGKTASEYLTSAEAIMAGLRKARELYRPDGLPIAFDLQIEAEVLGCELNWADDGPPSVTSHPLELGISLADLPELSRDKGRIPVVAEATRLAAKEFGDDMALYGLICGPFTLALHMLGNMIFLEMYDNPDKVTELLEFCTKVGKQMADVYLDNGADVIAVVDPMTSQISSEHFLQFVTPHVNALFDHVRTREAYTSLFVCGDATRNLDVMGETTCHNMSVDENIPLDYLKEIAGKHGKSFGGNLKLTLSLLLGSADTCRADALDCIDVGGDTGFVLAPGCDLPWGVPPENLQAVGEMVHEDYQREVFRTKTRVSTQDSFDDIVLPDYAAAPHVSLDVVTLNAATCAPCQYMLEAANAAAAQFGDRVQVHEHRIGNRQGIGYFVKLGAQVIPTLCVDGVPKFRSLIPDHNTLVKTVEEALAAKA